MLTLEELKQKLAERLDEITLLELLGINSYDIVERFEDFIENNYDRLMKEIEDEYDINELQ
jgi:hypothetical protein